MASTSATATIRLGVDLASLQTGLQQAATLAEQKGQTIKAALMRATDSGVDGFKNMGSSIASALNPINLVTSALGSMTATLGIGAGAAGLGGMIAASITAAESMADLSIKTGIQVEQLSRFSSIAKLSGASMEDVAGIVKKLSISAVDAYSGNDKLARSFDAIGISTKELKSISPDELLIRVAQGIQGIDPMIVQDLMAQLGGKGASNVLPFLRELTERIDETGVKISTQFASDAKIFSDNLKLIEINVKSLGVSIATQLIPQYNILFDTLRNGQGVFNTVIEALKNDLAIMGVDFRKLPEEIQKAQTELETATGLEKSTLERRLAVLQKHQAAVTGVLANEIDPNKTAAAQRAIASNNASGGSDGFIKGLQARIEKAEQGEYAMLRLQAAEKGVSSAAGPLIDQLKKIDEAKSVSNYEDNLVRQNAEIEFQNSLIGRSAAEVAMLNIERKAELELAKQIEQIERAKGALSDESIAKMQAATEASIAIQKASISSRLEMERTWQTGATTSLQKYLDSAENIAKGTEDAFTRAFKGVEDAFVSLAMTGSLNFTNLTNSIIADIIRLQARAATAGLVNFLGQTLGNMFAGSVTGTGYTSDSPTGPGTYNYAGSEMTIAPLKESALGNVFSGAPSLSAYSNTVQTSPKYFNYSTLHRFANGGVFAEAGPEAVMPLTRMGNGKLGVQSLGSGGTVVNIYNQMDGSETKTRESTDAMGNKTIDVFILDVVNKGITSGKLGRSLEGTYGLRRALA